MDENVDPCDRFYEYACGKWNHFHPIPKDKGGYDIFEILREDMDAKLIQVRIPAIEFFPVTPSRNQSHIGGAVDSLHGTNPSEPVQILPCP